MPDRLKLPHQSSGDTMIYRPAIAALAVLTVMATSPAGGATDYRVAEPLLYAVQEASPSDIHDLEPGGAAKPDVPVPQPAGGGAYPRATTLVKKPAANPCLTSHKGLFYQNDFSYLNSPDYCGCCLGDSLKLMPVDPCGHWGTIDVGGQLRLRYHHERGMGQEPGATRFEDTTNDFLLTRLRTYVNWQIDQDVRFYMEGIYADVTADEDYVYRPTDCNYGDFLNLFVDLKLTNQSTVRLGRQELLYGNQRLVSPLDWSNTRRTFDGVKWIYTDGDWSVDTFFTHLVVVDPSNFDKSDYQQRFYGTYAVYSGRENSKLDLYYLGYDNDSVGGPAASDDFSLHTLGARVYGERGSWLYEFEGAGQFGRQSGLGLDHEAAFGTAGLGRKLSGSWSPVVWVYYDYASGNNVGGDFNRFNDLFPLGHRYLGFIDAVLRRNIESPNVLLTMDPSSKTKFLLWYHHFMANQETDIVPSIGGTPAQSTASKFFGNELDLILQRQLTPRSNVLFGWSHFWRGNKILAEEDADFFYSQWELNF